MDITEVNYRRRLLRKNRCVKIKNKDIISLYAEDKDVISATGTTIREIAFFYNKTRLQNSIKYINR